MKPTPKHKLGRNVPHEHAASDIDLSTARDPLIALDASVHPLAGVLAVSFLYDLWPPTIRYVPPVSVPIILGAT